MGTREYPGINPLQDEIALWFPNQGDQVSIIDISVSVFLNLDDFAPTGKICGYLK
jgi:hypothetical protein